MFQNIASQYLSLRLYPWTSSSFTRPARTAAAAFSSSSGDGSAKKSKKPQASSVKA
ncbi:hypothetical protein [Streptomyces sp. NPDC101455]|uniref:hypothetical protein n=1 Tax=Streptomyces sp. NPDC101455 TaxID=3366142 RepID=UPI00382E82BD